MIHFQPNLCLKCFFFLFFLILYACLISCKIWIFFLKGVFYQTNWCATWYDFWQVGKGGKPFTDFWLTRGGGWSGLPIFGLYNVWTAPNLWTAPNGKQTLNIKGYLQTWNLSQAWQAYLCKFFGAGVQFYLGYTLFCYLSFFVYKTLK